jgi:PQQ-like domain
MSQFNRLFLCFLTVIPSLTLTFLRPTAASDLILPLGGSAGAGLSSPFAADLDGDPTNGLEIVGGRTDGVVTATRRNGTVLWSTALPNATCTMTSSDDKLYSSPAVGDLNGDGRLSVVIGYGGYRGKPCDGGVAALDGRTGAIQWRFSLKDFARKRRHFAFRHAVFGTPALADVDGDGRLEIGFGGFDRHVYLLNSDGSVRWYYQAADTVFSSPTFYDVDGDGKKEMLIGTDISQNKQLRPPTPNGGYLYALRASLRPPARNPLYVFRDQRLVLWRAQFDQVLQSSVSVGELIPENQGGELIFGAGCFFPQGGGERRGKWFSVVSARTGKLLRRLTVESCSPSLPAIADLNGDGVNEAVVLVNSAGSQSGTVIAWEPARDTVLWSQSVFPGGARDPKAGDFGRSAVIADLDRNGSLEVAVAGPRGVSVFAGQDGARLSCGGEGCDDDPYRIVGRTSTAPALVDIDADGTLELLTGGNSDGAAAVFVWFLSPQRVGSLPGVLEPGSERSAAVTAD